MRNRTGISAGIIAAVLAISAPAYATPGPVTAESDCKTITVTIGEATPVPRIPYLYVTTVAVADGDRTWELSDGDTLTVDRSPAGSAWAVWVHGDLLATGVRDDDCERSTAIVVDVGITPIKYPTFPHPTSGSAPIQDGRETGNPSPTPAGVRWN